MNDIRIYVFEIWLHRIIGKIGKITCEIIETEKMYFDKFILTRL